MKGQGANGVLTSKEYEATSKEHKKSIFKM